MSTLLSWRVPWLEISLRASSAASPPSLHKLYGPSEVRADATWYNAAGPDANVFLSAVPCRTSRFTFLMAVWSLFRLGLRGSFTSPERGWRGVIWDGRD